ncbi:MAG: hypothetical protein A3E80_02895 [Chlamydiae bacterium RIFCSPHIGHO2_12_FULL_49_9]|nr:MAG: hypothetical protein A3E80_02895 [Chlamydiae bacterium RIFCSPHIGHO2_12_FULL_49_9]
MNENIFLSIDLFLLSYFLILNGFYGLLLILTNPELARRFQEIKANESYKLLLFNLVPPVSIIIPAYNERETILASVTAALQIEFSHFEVIVIDDGSTDDTFSLLTTTYQLFPVPPVFPSILQTAPVKHYYRSKLYPKLLVIQKENGGREDAINAGINASTAPFFIGIDADSFIEPDAINRLMQHLLTKRNICAMGGTLCIVNGCTVKKGKITEAKLPPSFLGTMQVVEYIKTFFFGRTGWNKLGGSPLISGGFGLFNKQAVIEVGGLKKMLAGDLELTVLLHKHMHEKKEPYVIDYMFDAIVWTDVPQTYSGLAKQRKRWHSSVIDVCWRHRRMIFNFKYGVVGFLHIPYLLLGEGLGPLVEGFGYIYIACCFFYGVLNITFFWYFILIAWGVSMFLTIASVIMQEVFLRKYISSRQILKMVFFAFIENFTYRPLTVWWRIEGFFRFFTKNRFMREKMDRSLSVK